MDTKQNQYDPAHLQGCLSPNRAETRPDYRERADCPQPKEHSLLTCAQELRGYLYELGKLQSDAISRLFLLETCDPSGRSEENSDTLEGVLRHSSRLAACLVSEARLINAKLIG